MVKLTQTVKKGGCAAKVAALELRDILGRVTFPKPHPNLKINGANFDDAAVYQLSDNLCLVETVDFFTPIVDDPYLFGRVAATNALSDVYAMGATPRTALAVLAIPLMTLTHDVAAAILQGAVDALAQAGADLAGGHSIDDDTLKFGLSVTGLAHPNEIWTNAGARAGDKMILTKGLGTGTLMAALKAEKLAESDLAEAFASMTALNAIRPLLSAELSDAIHAATDITGFGLAGHGSQMARASFVTIQFSAALLPELQGARSSLANGNLTKAHRTNREYTEKSLRCASEVTDLDRLLFFDPQTSGGLLLSVAPEGAERICASLKGAFPKVSIVGDVLPPGDVSLLYEK